MLVIANSAGNSPPCTLQLAVTCLYNSQLNKSTEQLSVMKRASLSPCQGESSLSTFKICFDAKLKYRIWPYDLMTAHIPICALSSNSVVFRLQPVYMLSTSYKGICCGYQFELHWLADAIQMSTHNICFSYVVATHLNCIDLSMQFKWVLITYRMLL